MTKRFLTDTDIEELFHGGVKSLRVDEDIVMTDLAFEKARKLGLLVESDTPPAAPVRPYLSETKKPRAGAKVDPVSSTLAQPAPAPGLPLRDAQPDARGDRGAALEKRIREKVAAKLGDQVEASLLDAIIKRTLKVVRLK